MGTPQTLKKRVVIFANGEFDDGVAVQAALSQPAWLMAADGGAELAARLGLSLQVLIGDFDSVTDATLAHYQAQGCELLRFAPDKNQTDLELAFLEATRRGAEEIVVIGALGKRLDHAIANIYLLNLPELQTIDVRLVAGQQTLRVLLAGEHPLMGREGDIISLIPLGGDVLGISTDEMKYPLKDEILAFGPARGVSNVIAGAAPKVRFQAGRLLMVHTQA